MLLPAAVCGC